MISIAMAVQIVLYLVIGGLIFWLLYFLVSRSPLPEPWKTVANFVLLALAVFVLIGILLWLATGQPIFRP